MIFDELTSNFLGYNKLRNLINTDNIAFLIDDLLVVIDIKEEYNKLVEVILDRVEKNNLYIKSKMYIKDKEG